MGTLKNYRQLKSKADRVIKDYNVEVEMIKMTDEPDFNRLGVIRKELLGQAKELIGSETRAKPHSVRTNLCKTYNDCQALLSMIDEIFDNVQVN
jgi:hypothetical protein